MRWLAAVGLLLLAACAGAPGGRDDPGARADRAVLARLPPAAEPTSVIATELAFARAAREQGQWTAYADYAADDALIAVPQPVAAREWLAGRANPASAERWAPRDVWSSCDGSAVLVAGISVDPAGEWSRFTRIWQRDGEGEFRWTHSASAPDPALTRSRREQAQARNEAQADEAILVEAASFIRARTAACDPPPQPLPADPSTASGGSAPEGAAPGTLPASRDGTLRWHWQAEPGGRAAILARFWTGQGWEIVPSDAGGPAGG